MKIIILNLFLVLTLMLSSCGRKAGDEVSNSIKEIYKFETKETSKSYKDCKPEAENCSYIRLKYIDFTSGKSKEKLNAFVKQALPKVYEMSEKKYSDITQMQDAFIKDFGDFMKEYPEAPQVWTLDYEIGVYSNTANFISIKEDNDSYLGGAHPNHYAAFTNFYAESGEMMKLSDLMVTGFEVKLNKLIDKKYRETMAMKSGEDLTDKGGLFENKIEFNQNFAITKNGIEFYYNPYEIAPYAVGPIEIKIPVSELSGLVRDLDIFK